MSHPKQVTLLKTQSVSPNSFWNKPETMPTMSYSEQMRVGLVFTPEKPPKENPILTLIHKIPLLSGFLNGISNMSGSVSKLIEIHGHITRTTQAIKNASPYTGLSLAIVDFIRIPMIYMAAFLVGEKLPMTLTKRAQWLYSSVLLGLTISALALPATAPVIAFVSAGIVLAVSVLTMGKALQQRYINYVELKKVTSEIAVETSVLRALHKETVALEAELGRLRTQKEEGKQEQIQLQLKEFKRSFDVALKDKKDLLQLLYNKQFKWEAYNKKTNNTVLMAKGIGLGLTALATSGLALTLFFPSVGIALMAASAVMGLLYVMVELSMTVFRGLLIPRSVDHRATPLSQDSMEHTDKPHNLAEEKFIRPGPDVDFVRHPTAIDSKSIPRPVPHKEVPSVSLDTPNVDSEESTPPDDRDSPKLSS